jgi:hypothetical protein
LHEQNKGPRAKRAKILARWEQKREQRRIQWALDDADREADQLEKLEKFEDLHGDRMGKLSLAQDMLDLPPSVFKSDLDQIRADLERDLASQRRSYEREKQYLAEEREIIEGVDRRGMERELEGICVLPPLNPYMVYNAYKLLKHDLETLRMFVIGW